MKRLALLVALSGTGACLDDDTRTDDVTTEPSPPEPDIVVAPGSLVFDLLSSGETQVKSFDVLNGGHAPLTVSNIEIAGAQAFGLIAAELSFVLDVDEQKTVDVEFTPFSAADFGQVLIHSDDTDTPVAPIDLSGQGTIPELEITPSSHDFGEISIPCRDTVQVSLKNIGTEDLVITEVEYTSNGLMTLNSAVLDAMLPLTLAPRAQAQVWVNAATASEMVDAGTLEVASNDPRGVISANQAAEAVYLSEVADQFTEPAAPPVDVLWMIDQSCSMPGLSQQEINNGISDFLTELDQIADWQLLQVTGQDGCGNSGVVDASTPGADILLSDNAFNMPFAGPWTEQLFIQADTALGLTQPADCNAGFLRPGAMLHIVFTSDEAEQSGIPWAGALATFQSYVADPTHLVASGILNVYSDDVCSNGNPGSPAGYEEIVYATGGATIDICAPGWGAQLADIARAGTGNNPPFYSLTRQPLEETIEVQVNGVVTADWTYTAGTNSVVIGTPPVGIGDIVDVTYAETAVCP